MALSERLALLVTLDGRGAVKGFEQVGAAAEKNLGKSTQKLDMLGKSFKTAGVGMIATGAVLAGGLFKTAMASEEAGLNVRKLENSLSNNSGLAGATADEFVALSQAIQGKTAADADNIVGGIAVLAQGKASASQIKELTPLVVDLARKKGIDEVSAFTMASKAVAGNAGALKKAGITVDESAFKTDAYGATVEALRTSVGGFAESEGKTFAGSIQNLKNEMGDLAEGVGVGVVDALSTMIGFVDPLVSTFKGLDPAVQGAVGKVAAFGAVGLIAGGVASTLIGSIITMRQNFGSAAKGIGDMIGSMKKLSLATGGVVLAVAAVAVAIGFAIWEESQQGIKLTKERMKGLQEQADATGKSFEELTLENLATDFASTSGKDFFKALGTDIVSVGDAIIGTDEEYKAFIEGLEGGKVFVQGATTNFDAYRDSIGASKDNVKGLAENQDALGVSSDELTTKFEAEKTAAQEAAAELDGMSSAIRRQFDEVTNSLDAQIGFEDALRKVDEGLKENGDSYDRWDPKGRENVGLLREAQSAIGELVAQRYTDTESVKEATTAGLFAVEMLKEKLRVAGLTEEQIKDLIVQYGLVVPEIVTTAVARTEQASTDINALDTKINNLTKDPKIITVSFVTKALMDAGVKFPKKEHGGPVSGGMPYIVGERGPELFVPNQSGQIIPNGAGGSTSSAAGGGGNQTIVVKIGDEVVARVVANAMATGSRRGVG